MNLLLFAYDENDLLYIYYDEQENIFYHEGGFMLFDIFSIMAPNEVYLFKLKKEDILVHTKANDIYLVSYDECADD